MEIFKNRFEPLFIAVKIVHVVYNGNASKNDCVIQDAEWSINGSESEQLNSIRHDIGVSAKSRFGRGLSINDEYITNVSIQLKRH